VVTAAYLEVWTAAGRELLALEGGQLTLGADPAADPTLSPLTADAGTGRGSTPVWVERCRALSLSAPFQ
jgi:hypothetical protein